MGITCEALDKEISALKAGKMTWDTVKQLNLLLDLRAKLGDDAGHGERLTDDELRAWLQHMDNADGSTGQHWKHPPRRHEGRYGGRTEGQELCGLR